MQSYFKYIPYKMREEIVSDYSWEISYLRSIIAKHPDKYSWIKDVGIIEDLLFLGIFYRKVVSPLLGTRDFTRYAMKNGVSQVQIGRLKVDAVKLRHLYTLDKDFQELLRKFNIPLTLLNYSSVEGFLGSLREHWDNHEYTKSE